MSNSKILGLGEDELLALDPGTIHTTLVKEEILHPFKVLNGLWLYNYDALEQGRAGKHAELKSGRCSNGFFFSKIVLGHANLQKLFAQQLAYQITLKSFPRLDWIAGIPKGAVGLGKDVGSIMNVKVAEIIKDAGKIEITSPIGAGETLLLVEDFCTKGTGFSETVIDIKAKNPDAII